MSDKTNVLGRRLRTYRELVGLTLKEVAHFTRISVSFLSDIEHGRGEPSVATLKRMAAFYKVSMDTLLADVPTAPAPGIAGLVDDYYQLMQIGDLGGVELG